MLEKFANGILRYRVLHIIYWIYAFTVELHLLQNNRPDAGYSFINYADAFNNIFYQVLSVYTCIYLLLPKYFNREKYMLFSGLTLLTIILSAVLNVITQIIYVPLVLDNHTGIGLHSILVIFIAKVVDTGTITVIFGLVVVAYSYYLEDKRNKQIEKEKILSELDFLKAQINPHFLFNALNSIYVMMKEDIKQSEQTLLKFSSLLRYQLYDCSTNRTTIDKEIDFLKNYVALEKVRYGENLSVSFKTPEIIPYFSIAPFLLIPFVENAFKHVSHFKSESNRIDIEFSFHRSSFYFEVINTCDEGTRAVNETTRGIGLQNVRRRLQLLYPQKHILLIERTEKKHAVKLTCYLDEN